MPAGSFFIKNFTDHSNFIYLFKAFLEVNAICIPFGV